MKKLAIIIIAVSASLARADLIDLTPGGFIQDPPTPLPPVYVDWLIKDWNRTVFSLPDSLFTLTGFGTPNATVSWDLTGTGYTFRWLFVLDDKNNMYRVPGRLSILGESTVTVDGVANIGNWAAYGTLPGQVPETGSTFLLFFFGLIFLAVNLFCQKTK